MTPELWQSLLPAVFGLAGVVVGGLITVGVEFWKTRRQEKRELIQGARLVLQELYDTMHVIQRCMDTNDYGPLRLYSIDDAAWKKYGPALTVSLGRQAWRDLRLAVREARRTSEVGKWSNKWNLYEVLADANERERLVISIRTLKLGIAALEPLSEPNPRKPSLFARIRSQVAGP